MIGVPKINILDLWEHYEGTYSTRGGVGHGWIRANCILHEDANASASLNEEYNCWTCFTCDKRGDAINLIMEKEDVGFVRAVEIAKGLTRDGNVGLYEPAQRRSSLLPGVPGDKRRRRKFVPSWKRG